MYNTISEELPINSAVIETKNTRWMAPSIQPPRCQVIEISSSPKVWGPHLWNYLHNCAAHYPSKPSSRERRNMRYFLWSLRDTLPCSKCRYHYGKAIGKCDIERVTSSKESLFAFIVKLHNAVNSRNHKSEIPVHDAWDLYA